MDNSEIELVGGPCGHHGPYTFYKAFKYSKNGLQRIISLCEFFFVKLWSDSDLVCIGELQLLWVDKNSEQMLSSLRLYFLPENTPEGRMDHGEDEVLAISEKVVLRLEDLLTWITIDTEWSWGRPAVCSKDTTEPEPPPSTTTSVPDPLETAAVNAAPLTDSQMDFGDVEKEKKVIDTELNHPAVIVLSYPRYCRYRSLMKRLEGVEQKWLRHSLVVALGGFAAPSRNTRILFCRDTFDYPDLEGHELLCNHLAPKLKGRPRGKRKKRSISPGGSESNESEASICVPATSKTRLTTAGGRNGLRCNSTTSPRRSTRSSENVEERDFLNKLHGYMKSHRTPIGRIPSIGYKEIDLFAFFKKVQKLGGYDSCTANRMWKPIFDELGGHHNSTSAATIMRRHYERLLLAFERHIKGEEYKPLPVSERRRLKSKTSSFSDAETSEDRSNSGHSTPVPTTSMPQAATVNTTTNEIREFSVPERTKPEGKTSSLRSVRVKPERLRDTQQKDKPSTPTTPEKPIFPSDKPNFSPDKPNLSNQPNKPNFSPDKAHFSTSSLPENSSNVPVTSAIAPVVEKNVPEKSVSPLEGKENIPVMNQEASVSQTRTESDDELIEVPYKPKTPEVIDLDSEPETNTITNNNSMIYDVKKRKLDILKEGGLEVTAITGFVENNSRDGRPSVIQPPKDLGNLSITVTSDRTRMPPPVQTQRSQSPKKALLQSLYSSKTLPGVEIQRRPPADVRINKQPPQTTTKPTLNGATPPKVLQSRSIYTYSERTVYGNPKDPFMPPPHTPQPPRHLMRSPMRPQGGEVLDLTVKSPQKPIVEIMRIPTLPARQPQVRDLSSRTYLKSPPVDGREYLKNSPLDGRETYLKNSLLDGRVGSNLEITLVSGGNTKTVTSKPKMSQGGGNNINNNQRLGQKRSSSGKFVNGGYPAQFNPNLGVKNGAQLVIPSPHPGNGRTHEIPPSNKMEPPKQPPIGNQFLPPSNNPLFPGYISQLAVAAASKNPTFPPMLDPLYYSALFSQNLYSPANLYPPVPTVDQLQLYKDLMAHSARGRFPFPMQPEGNPSITSVGQSLDPNMMKK